MSKIIFLTTIAIAALRDAFTNASNLDLYASVVCGMVVAVTYYLIFDRRRHE